MNRPDEDPDPPQPRAKPRRRLTLAQYIRRRNGVPVGAPGSLRNMLDRSLGARSFAVFWQYWNPVWGYALARYVYSPLRKLTPTVIAVLLTFIVCGAVHDLAASAIMGTRSVVCTLWFCLLGVGVVISSALKMDLSRRPWWPRALVNLTYVGGCLALALAARAALGL